MTAPRPALEQLQVRAPLGIWALVVGGLFHAARARRPDDRDVHLLEAFAGQVVNTLKAKGVSDAQIDEALYALAVCEHCGCAEHRACEGGCGWSPDHLKAERFVCSRCASKVPVAGEDRYGHGAGLILPGDARFTLPGRRP